MIKMIFSDFDNTMLDYYSKDNYFDDYKLGVLSKLKEKGIKFCIVTGRSVPFFEQFPGLLDVVDYIAGSNGGCIYDVKNRNFIYQSVVDEDVFSKVIAYTYDNDGGFLLNNKGKRFKYGEWKATDCLEYTGEEECDFEQIILSFNKEKLQEVLKYLEQFKSISVSNIDYLEDFCVIDINNKDVSKGNAAAFLVDYLDIDISDVMAFGDGVNDRSLFETINKGIAVGNAVEQLKTLSKEVALTCHDNGIYKYIEEHILK